MKMHVEHRVPLSNSAVELLRATAANSNRPPDAYVFAGQKRGCPLSNVSMTAVLKRMRLGHLTVHGMRSEEHTSELQSLMRISYAVFCLKKKKKKTQRKTYKSLHLTVSTTFDHSL